MNIADLIEKYRRLGIADQIDSRKFYLYSLITHSTAIEGSTVTELENQLLFDEGTTAKGRSMIEQLMNLDLKAAYDYGMDWIQKHEDFTVGQLCKLSSMVIARTGSEYNTSLGSFSSAKGDLRLVNVSAGFGGHSYLSFQKVPSRLEEFCKELNRRRRKVKADDIEAIYYLSFWAHYELVTIHPWADGNGRVSRLVMNLLQMEHDLPATKVMKEEKSEYIEALVKSREQDDTSIFTNTMMRLHERHLDDEIQVFQKDIGETDEISTKKRNTEENRQAILDFISENGNTKAEILAQILGLSSSRTRDYLRQMVQEGLLVTQGANKNRTYSISIK